MTDEDTEAASRRGPHEPLPQLTDRLRLGPSALPVSPFCLGYVADPDVVSAAFDAGINFFFITTDMHWPVYEATRRGLRTLLARGGGVRDRIVVAGVTYCTQPEFLRLPFEELIAEVPGLDRIDALVAGGSYTPDILGRLRRLEENRALPSIGGSAIGASFHDREAAAQTIAHDLLDVAYVRYNAGHTGARSDLFPAINRPRRSLVFNFNSTQGWRPHDEIAKLSLGDDVWLPEVSDHYRFVLTQRPVDGVLCSLRNVSELEALVSALRRPPLDEEEERYLVGLYLLAMRRAESLSGS